MARRFPDLVGRLRYDNGRIGAHLAGAARWLEWQAPVAESRLGYAVTAGLRIAFAETLTPDQRFAGMEADRSAPELTLSASYASGASAYLGFGRDAPDTACPGFGDCVLVTGWSAALGYRQPLGEALSATLSASYGALDLKDGLDPLAEWRIGGRLDYHVAPLADITLDIQARGRIDARAAIAPTTSVTPRVRFSAGF
jgi:hypothetical protein